MIWVGEDAETKASILRAGFGICTGPSASHTAFCRVFQVLNLNGILSHQGRVMKDILGLDSRAGTAKSRQTLRAEARRTCHASRLPPRCKVQASTRALAMSGNVSCRIGASCTTLSRCKSHAERGPHDVGLILPSTCFHYHDRGLGTQDHAPRTPYQTQRPSWRTSYRQDAVSPTQPYPMRAAHVAQGVSVHACCVASSRNIWSALNLLLRAYCRWLVLPTWLASRRQH